MNNQNIPHKMTDSLHLYIKSVELALKSQHDFETIEYCFRCEVNPAAWYMLDHGPRICNLCKTGFVNQIFREEGYAAAVKTNCMFKQL